MATTTRKNRSSAAAAKKRSQARLRKYWNSVHKRNKGSKCIIMQTTKKYRTRPSPPYSANDCCGKTMTGNDGSKYISAPNAYGICAWKKV